MHDADQSLDHEPMVMILEFALMIFTVDEQVLKQFLKQWHSEIFMVQISILGECLLEDAEKG